MSSPAVPAGMLEQVRDQLARDGAELTPEHVAQALRDRGRPVGDATVLAVHDALRRDVVGAGPLEPLLRTDRRHRRAGQRARPGLPRPRSRARAHRRPAARRGVRAPSRTAARGVGRPAARRRDAVRRPAAARRQPLPRRARAGLPARHRAVAAGAAGAGVHAGRAGRGPRPPRGGRLAAPPDRREPAGLPGQRRHRLGQDHAAQRSALAGRPDRAAGAGRGRKRAPARPSPRRRAGGAPRQHRGRRRDHAAHPGAPGAPHAPRPARASARSAATR